nr:cytochrome c oxidase subunit 3 [Goniodes ortygis]
MGNLFKLGFHPFHIVDYSPWPLISSLSVFSLVTNMYHYLNSSGSSMWLICSFISTCMVMVLWWRDVIRESTFQGSHTLETQSGLYIGMILFIISECMFFVSFFFGYFFSALCPDIKLGSQWPPLGVEPLSYKMVPLMNTLILLSSGVSISWSHHSLVEGSYFNALVGAVVTVLLGGMFMYFQYEEYFSCSFTMADSVYGSFFFMMTGFHGLHVIVGAIFIGVSTYRIMALHFSNTHHLGFEASAWYWHFVDVVWLFLYVVVYWWGS